MDILYLLDRLEEVLSSGSRLPFTSRTLVDEDECLDILDQIRVAIPEELKAARRLTQERDQLLAEARAEADRVVREADQQVAGRVTDHALVVAAQTRANQIEQEAMQQAEELRREADRYAYRALERLRHHLVQVDEAIERGLHELSLDEQPEGQRAAR